MTNKLIKNQTKKRIQHILLNSSNMLIIHYNSFQIVNFKFLKNEPNNIKIEIIKNNIIKNLLKNTKYCNLENLFSGPTLIAYSLNFNQIKLILNYLKENKNLILLGAVFENQILNVKDLEKLNKLNSIEEPKLNILKTLKKPIIFNQKLLNLKKGL
jgi:large subunit ribosomal protein L10